MPSAKPNDTSPFYQPLPSEPQSPEHLHQQPQYVIVLPYHCHLRRRLLRCRRLLCIAAVLPFIVAATCILWPSDPELSIVRLRLDGPQIHTSPEISLDIKLNLTVKVRNRDFYSIDYDSLAVAIGYRGDRLGYVTSDCGYVRARGQSYVNATLQLDGVEILSDVILLLEDLAKGSVPFDTVTEIDGKLGVFFFNIPLKAKLSCEIIVNAHNQTIDHQSCYPE
ncbi:Late embryogenesis abundant (LEA) hydroxyproline-rich glycoprotein family [Forsythia ovata]|uniref:Late embryogenesis abundant (LEA) hydroxyproline-rich glycoprotein family n=1 Tax=Forsythia ovata TaxID=205694 RepID=A0ABD1PGT9_9LAMI